MTNNVGVSQSAGKLKECVSMGAEGAQTHRSFGHHLLNPRILRPIYNRLHPQIQIPNACPEGNIKVLHSQLHRLSGRLAHTIVQKEVLVHTCLFSQ